MSKSLLTFFVKGFKIHKYESLLQCRVTTALGTAGKDSMLAIGNVEFTDQWQIYHRVNKVKKGVQQ